VFILNLLSSNGSLQCPASSFKPQCVEKASHRVFVFLDPFLDQYYTLPFFRTAGKQKRHHHELGEDLVGDRKVTSPYQVKPLL